MKHDDRRFWLVASLVLVGLVAGVSWWLGRFLWATELGSGAIMAIYLAWGLLILGTSAVCARGVAYVAFPSRASFNTVTTDVNMEGERVRKVAMFQVSTFLHSLLVVGFMAAMALGGNVLSSGALFSTNRVMLEALSRSSDPEELKELMQRTRDMYTPEETIHFTKLLLGYMEHRDEGVREEALTTAAVMGRRMNLAVSTLAQQKTLLGSRWEPELLAWLRGEMAAALRERVRSGRAPVELSVEALAWIACPEELDLFVRLATDRGADMAVREAAVIGLGNLGRLEGIDALLEVLGSGCGVDRGVLFHALVNIASGLSYDPLDDEGTAERVYDLGVRLMTLAESSEDYELTCLLVRTVAEFEHSGMTEYYIRLFEEPGSERPCPRVEYAAPTGPPEALVSEQSLRFMLVNAMADVAVGNELLARWLERALTSGDYAGESLEALEALGARMGWSR